MKKSNFVLAETFYKFREKPKWLVNMILSIVLELIIVWIFTLTSSKLSIISDVKAPSLFAATTFI